MARAPSYRRAVLDTSVLLGYWNQVRAHDLSHNTPQHAKDWAKDLVGTFETDAIVTPVYIEVIAGVLTKHQFKLTQAFLSAFRCIDEGRILPEDLDHAIRLAQRIPREPQPRDLGDCLIRAIASRLKHEVISLDEAFPR